MKLNRELLRSSQYALRSIPRRFPLALPRNFRSVDRWKAPIQSRLILIHDHVHYDKPLPHWSQLPLPQEVISKAKNLARAQSLNERLIHAFIWTYWDEKQTSLDGLNFLATFNESILHVAQFCPENIEITVLKLFQIYEQSPDQVAPILDKFALNEFWNLATNSELILEQISHHLFALRHTEIFFSGTPCFVYQSEARREAQGSPKLGLVVLDNVLRTHHASIADQRSFLLLCQSVIPSCELLKSWSSWWREVVELCRILPKPSNFERTPIQFSHSLRDALEARLSQLRRSKPSAFSRELAANSLNAARQQWRGPCAESISQIFPIMNRKEVLSLSKYWQAEFDQVHSIPFIFSELQKFFGNCHGVENWKLWSGLSPLRLSTELWDIYNDEDREYSQKEIQCLLRMLKASMTRDLKGPEFKSPNRFNAIWHLHQKLIRLPLNNDDLMLLAVSLPADRLGSEPLGSLYCYWVLSQGSLTVFQELLSKSQDHSLTISDEHLTILKNNHTLCRIVRESIVGKHRHRVQSLLNRLILLRQFQAHRAEALVKRWQASLTPKTQNRPSHYPVELSLPIQRIIQFDPRAPRSLKKILGKDYPNPAETRAEIAHLQELENSAGASEKLKARLRKLKLRTITKKASPKRIQHLLSKLEDRIQWCQLNALSESLDAEFNAPAIKSNPYLGIIHSCGKEWLRVLTAIQQLTPKWRKISEYILSKRLSSENLNFSEIPKNAEFINEMKKLGLNLDPWLNQAPRQEVGEGDELVTVTIERDPLEIFLMGQHFSTCLSPFSMNFFSVLSNCIDANKQVIYARNKSGVVKARCLLALNQSGELLRYLIYQHEADELTKPIEKYIETLVKLMKTKVSKKGHVQNLVAPNWYDDGPISPTRATDQEIRQRFEERLDALESAQVVQSLESEFGVLTLDMAKVIFELIQIRQNHSLYGAFLDAYPDWTREESLGIHVLSWAKMTGNTAQIRSTLEWITKTKLWRSWLIEETLQIPRLWLDLGYPHKARRFLSRTKERGSSWRDEACFARLLLWLEIFVAFKRPSLAKDAYDRSSKAKNSYSENLDRLEKVKEKLSHLLGMSKIESLA